MFVTMYSEDTQIIAGLKFLASDCWKIIKNMSLLNTFFISRTFDVYCPEPDIESPKIGFNSRYIEKRPLKHQIGY